eukprot:2185375-Rhodomonas_salina.2
MTGVSAGQLMANVQRNRVTYLIQSALIDGSEGVVDKVGAEEERERENRGVVLERVKTDSALWYRSVREEWHAVAKHCSSQAYLGRPFTKGNNQGKAENSHRFSRTCSSASTDPIPSVSMTRKRPCDPSRLVCVSTLLHIQIPRVHDAMVAPTLKPLGLPRRIWLRRTLFPVRAIPATAMTPTGAST